MKRINSFNDFVSMNKEQITVKINEDNGVAFNTIASEIKVILNEMDLSPLDVLTEDQRNEFAVSVFKQVYEGRMFVAAAKKAKDAGESEFEFDGKTFQVTLEEQVNEGEVKSDDDFKDYAMTVLKKAFGDDFDEDKANKVISGLISKHDGDYGAMIGALKSSLG